jgi:hypothetical protein
MPEKLSNKVNKGFTWNRVQNTTFWVVRLQCGGFLFTSYINDTLLSQQSAPILQIYSIRQRTFRLGEKYRIRFILHHGDAFVSATVQSVDVVRDCVFEGI